MAKDFKSISEKAATRFISSAQIENTDDEIDKSPGNENKVMPVPAPKKRKYELREDRVSLRIKPSMKGNLDKLSIIHGKSLNNFIEYVLEEYIKNNRDAIAAYDAEMNAINGREWEE